MNHSDAKDTLRSLLGERDAGVLATSKDNWPYANLVAFAVSDTLREMVFATPRQSKKYTNLTANPRVAILIDNRSNDISDLTDTVAATAIGMTTELDGSERERCLAFYIERHPHLNDFARSPSTAVFLVTVERYIMVSRFQNVVEIAV